MLIVISVGSRMANIQTHSRACFECSFLLCSMKNLSSCLQIISSGWIARVVNVYDSRRSLRKIERVSSIHRYNGLIDFKPHSNPILHRLMSCLSTYKFISFCFSFWFWQPTEDCQIVSRVHIHEHIYRRFDGTVSSELKWLES